MNFILQIVGFQYEHHALVKHIPDGAPHNVLTQVRHLRASHG